jgi:hypothetical protein
MSLSATMTRIPFLSVRLAFSATERHAVQRKNPSLTSCHSPLCLLGWLTPTMKFARAAHSGVAELGIVGDDHPTGRAGFYAHASRQSASGAP